MFADEAGDGLGMVAGLHRIHAGRERRPERRVAPREKGDGRRAHGRGAAIAAAGLGVARPQPGPGYPSGQALIVEPGGLVFADPRRQDFAFPGAGRRLEAFELRDHDLDRVRTLHSRIGRHALPGQKEAQEIAGGDRLDLGPQPLDGIAMDAGQQAALAPFVVIGAGGEAAAHHEAFGLQRGEGLGDLMGFEAQGCGQRGLGDGPQPLEPAAQDLDQRRLRRPARRAIAGGDCDLRRQAGAWETAPGIAPGARRRSRSRYPAPRAARPACPAPARRASRASPAPPRPRRR